MGILGWRSPQTFSQEAKGSRARSTSLNLCTGINCAGGKRGVTLGRVQVGVVLGQGSDRQVHGVAGRPGQSRRAPLQGGDPGREWPRSHLAGSQSPLPHARMPPDSGLQLWTLRHGRQRGLRPQRRVGTQARRSRSYRGRKFGSQASPLRPWEPIGVRSLGARALTRSVLRPRPPAP